MNCEIGPRVMHELFWEGECIKKVVSGRKQQAKGGG